MKQHRQSPHRVHVGGSGSKFPRCRISIDKKHRRALLGSHYRCRYIRPIHVRDQLVRFPDQLRRSLHSRHTHSRVQPPGSRQNHHPWHEQFSSCTPGAKGGQRHHCQHPSREPARSYRPQSGDENPARHDTPEDGAYRIDPVSLRPFAGGLCFIEQPGQGDPHQDHGWSHHKQRCRYSSQDSPEIAPACVSPSIKSVQ